MNAFSPSPCIDVEMEGILGCRVSGWCRRDSEDVEGGKTDKRANLHWAKSTRVSISHGDGMRTDKPNDDL